MTRDRAIATIERQQEVICALSKYRMVTFPMICADPNAVYKVMVFFKVEYLKNDAC